MALWWLGKDGVPHGSWPKLTSVYAILEASHTWIVYCTALISSIAGYNLILFFGTSPQKATNCPSIFLAAVWIFHLGLYRRAPKTRQSHYRFRFCNLSLFSCSKITPLSLAFYFSSQLYPHSYPQTLFKLEEMRPTSLVKKKLQIFFNY